MVKNLFKYVFISTLAIFLSGCNLNEEDKLTPEIISITPEDGATEVAKTVSIQVEFDEPMDTGSCESRFGLITGYQESIPVNMMGSLSGEFEWNDDHTNMMFTSDSLLMDSTMYSICLEEGMEMHDHGGDSMMSDGMMGHGTQTSNGIISYFTTH
ncbi:MAG: Ig-like domain-containing protein [Candidatus Marinimicrobia bacterium]|nr:Ig-like domain-containing protein [Candidatus Neomarinimicrobiota bacterium]